MHGCGFEPAPVTCRVMQIARLLGVEEFDVFRQAHCEWYGESASNEQLEPHFLRYIVLGRTPFWVRHYARRALADDVLPSPGPATG